MGVSTEKHGKKRTQPVASKTSKKARSDSKSGKTTRAHQSERAPTVNVSARHQQQRLEHEVQEAGKKIYRDGYDMSFGELISLYSKGELNISPEYQRLFRWTDLQKTRFVESLLLNIPIPPIFVFSDEHGVWELVDGLQRLSTVLQVTGNLKSPPDGMQQPFVLGATSELPSLDGMRWPSDDGNGSGAPILPSTLQLTLKRSRVRVEILAKNSDPRARFELFQRLNTGGANLSEQEVRSCVIYSLNRKFFDFINRCAGNSNFLHAVSLSDDRRQRQFDKDLVTRWIVYRHIPYDGKLDVNEYIDAAVIELAERKGLSFKAEADLFERMMLLLDTSVGEKAFRPGERKFSVAAFEFVALGLSRRLEAGSVTETWLKARLEKMRTDERFQQFTASGITGSRRLSKLIFPFSAEFFA